MLPPREPFRRGPLWFATIPIPTGPHPLRKMHHVTCEGLEPAPYSDTGVRNPGLSPPRPNNRQSRATPRDISCGGRNPFSLTVPLPLWLPAPHPSFPRPTRHSCGEPAPCTDTGQESILSRSVAPPVIPGPHPSFLRRQESIPSAPSAVSPLPLHECNRMQQGEGEAPRFHPPTSQRGSIVANPQI